MFNLNKSRENHVSLNLSDIVIHKDGLTDCQTYGHALVKKTALHKIAFCLNFNKH